MTHADRHEQACHVDDDGDQRCVYWCEIGGCVPVLRRCVEHLEKWGGNPATGLIVEAREALRVWDTR